MQLYPPQAEVLAAGLLDSGFSCVLGMPTGSGKTWLAEQAIAAVLARGERAVYLAPLRALAAELATRWRLRFPDHPVGVCTGDVLGSGGQSPSFADARLLVMTPERLDLCTRAWRTHWHWLPEVDLVIADELHLLGDAHRGGRLEGTLSRLRRLNPFARILGLSATLGNRAELADWLEAADYHSDWRPVPLTWRIVRYRRAEDKPACLAAELARCRDAGGKGLVFVQSRRRAEQVAAALIGLGLCAAHHHAGLDRARRAAVESGFRGAEYDCLVATSTLEMGLNLPVRQVVLYDLQEFDGSGFVPLPTNTVWQRVGRAGRPGLDPEGEAVLLAAAWDRAAGDYPAGRFEPIASRLADPRVLAEQLVVEVAAGYGRTPTQLGRIMAGSLAARQGRLTGERVRETLDTLLEAGLLAERAGATGGDAEPAPARLTVTPLGRVAVRHLLYPATVLAFRRACACPGLAWFDLLLLVAAVPDCEPVLPVDYEELATLGDALRAEPSHLLALPRGALAQLLGAGGKRLLAALKMALALRARTLGEDIGTVAARLGCHPFELERLAESAERLLVVLTDLARVPDGADPQSSVPGWQCDTLALSERAARLRHMVAAGIDEHAATLTQVPGIGSRIAARLAELGVCDLDRLAVASPADLISVRGLSAQRAAAFIAAARLIVAVRAPAEAPLVPAPVPAPTAPNPPVSNPGARSVPDPYRLRRARDLRVQPLGGGRYRVTGGTDPHEVRERAGTLRCDCADFRKGQPRCKHILAVRLARGAAPTGTPAPAPDGIPELLDLWLDPAPLPAVPTAGGTR